MAIKKIIVQYEITDEHGNLKVDTMIGSVFIRQPDDPAKGTFDTIVIDRESLADLIDVLVEIDNEGTE